MAKKKRKLKAVKSQKKIFSDITKLIQQARGYSVRSINSIMTATYWEIGRKIIEVEQGGKNKAKYGTELISELSLHLN